MKLKEIYKNQENWKLVKCYAMILKHGLMGTFPLLQDDTTKIVLTLDKSVMKKLWESLRPRRVELVELNTMANFKEGLVIPLDQPEGDDCSSDDWLLVQFFDPAQAEGLRYASGLLSLEDESNTKFPE